jgi:hypothetical protein
MHITELFAKKYDLQYVRLVFLSINQIYIHSYSFQVLHNVWMSHLPHKVSQYFQEFLQSIETKLKNRALRFEVLRNIIDKYNIKLYNC